MCESDKSDDQEKLKNGRCKENKTLATEEEVSVEEVESEVQEESQHVTRKGGYKLKYRKNLKLVKERKTEAVVRR